MRDVAAEAGVSVATASVVLRGEPGFRSSTRERILDTARRMHYTANMPARFLKQGASGVIAFVVPDLANPYFSDLAWAVSRSAARHGYQTIVQPTNASLATERDFLKKVNSPMCDGLILSLHNVPEDELRSLIGDHPAVLFEDYSEQPLYDNVALPLEAAFRTAFSYLRERGYRHAAVVGGRRFADGEVSARGRNVGSRLAVKAMVESGMGTQSDVIACDWTVSGGAHVAVTAIHDDLEHDALFCMNDLIAFGVVQGLRNMGIRIPKDKAVCGFDGVSPASYASPQLSTIAVDFDGMAESAVAMLVERIRNRSEDAPKRVDSGFCLIRGETA
nr:LacI family DNA-binding transcriptional regulator [Bifidobacterium sp. DSM 109957]